MEMNAMTHSMLQHRSHISQPNHANMVARSVVEGPNSTGHHLPRRVWCSSTRFANLVGRRDTHVFESRCRGGETPLRSRCRVGENPAVTHMRESARRSDQLVGSGESCARRRRREGREGREGDEGRGVGAVGWTDVGRGRTRRGRKRRKRPVWNGRSYWSGVVPVVWEGRVGASRVSRSTMVGVSSSCGRKP